jgi:hypothetical protein
MNIAGRVLQRAAVRIAGAVIGKARLIGFVIVAVGGVVLLSALDVLPFDIFGASTTSSEAYRPADGEPSSTSTYIMGLQNADARMVWGSYSERATRDLQRRGGSLEDTQRQLDRAREVGNRIQQVQYVGAYPIPNGSMHFYVVARAARSQRDVAYTPYVFTLDSSGKIDKVE